MGKDKGQKKASNRFEVGTHGGCEASLFEFTEKQPLEPHVVRIVALRLDEALAYLRWQAPDFVIESVKNLGIALMVSGSPVD